uniref:Uncharacterized protein n=2 Tax=Ditylum brightwellii TaxID=49249 RepID=A0A6S8ZP55_9STRA|mmetsp:Transcript_34727/g.46601  ORF Transcript_34727/g.46601 Transcript_34727/m.46601 type:complete len:103 (+) Transcript_34727:81-389(+)
MATNRLGRNLILSSFLATLSYVPFEYVAKFTLLLCAITFIFDPFPPFSRLVALGSVVVVLGLTKLERNWRMMNDSGDGGEMNEENEEENKDEGLVNAHDKND